MRRREIVKLASSEEDIPAALRWADSMIRKGLPAGPVMISLGRERRNLDQNAKLWALLSDIAQQCEMVIGGVLTKASAEDWKDVFTASLCGHQRMAQGIDGGVVFLGLRTSRMEKDEFSELIELILAYGAEHGVTWSYKAEQAIEAHRKAA